MEFKLTHFVPGGRGNASGKFRCHYSTADRFREGSFKWNLYLAMLAFEAEYGEFTKAQFMEVHAALRQQADAQVQAESGDPLASASKMPVTTAGNAWWAEFTSEGKAYAFRPVENAPDADAS